MLACSHNDRQPAGRCRICSAATTARKITKPCTSCGASDWDMSGGCRPCRKVTQARRRLKPCGRCGLIDRAPTGGCRPCASAYARRRSYGITTEDVRLLVVAQDGACAVCGVAGQLHVDHCHATGRVRGMLCGRCNRAIGLLRDDSKLCLAAAEYLELA